MPLRILGINHRSAPVEIREQVAFSGTQLPGALTELVRLPDVSEMLIVSTCNRTELYSECDPDGVTRLQDWLESHSGTSSPLTRCLYTHADHNAIGHTFSVACGLDSAVLGEPQILGQMKQAYRVAKESGSTGPVLHDLFQQAFAVAKLVRTDTDIGVSAVSVAYAAVSLARQIFSGFDRHTALLIGAGETVELAARHLSTRGIGRLIIANRSAGRARSLAHRFRGYAISLDEIDDHLAEADMVISSTASPTPLLGRQSVERALKARRHRPMFVVDLAVPRDVEPEVGELGDVYLYTVDDLQGVIRDNLHSRREAARQAREIIQAEVDRFHLRLRVRDAAPTIRAVRDRAGTIRDEVSAEAARRLGRGQDPREVIDYLASTLTNKLMHSPSTRLRKAGEDGDTDLLRAAESLFGLQHAPDEDADEGPDDAPGPTETP